MKSARIHITMIHPRRAFTLFGSILVACSFAGIALSSAPASALIGSDFQANHIIDDAIFTNSNAMSVADIQNFLNAKVGTCDTYGTQSSTHYNSGASRYYTHAEWGAINGNAAPYTCINQYVENPSTHQNNYSAPTTAISGGLSAAQIIYNSAQQYQINPQVILTTLQKEQGLVTDNWPWYYEYQSAMGYGCPDTASCASQYYGFSNQVSNAAWQFHYYMTHPGAFNYWIGANYIKYNPNASCNGSVVNITNAATAALYIYTPYQPNTAALGNLTGIGDSCSSYGNRNFWYYFNTWFGATTVDVYPWSVQEVAGGDGRYWLVVGNTKRWIPNGTILNDWNLDSAPIQMVTQGEIDAIPTLPNLGNLGVLKDGSYVFVDNGQRYYLGNSASVANWGYGSSLPTAVPLYSVLATMPNENTGTVNQYVQQTGSSAVYLMSGGTLYPIDPTYLSRWAIPNTTTLTAANIALLPQGATIKYQLSFNGVNYLADSGHLLSVNSAMATAYGSSVASGYVAVNPATGGVFSTTAASSFVQASGSVNCYLVIGAKQYYVLNGKVLSAWGVNNTPAQSISSSLLASLPSGGLLGTLVQSTTDSSYYLLDGSAHQIPASMVNAYTAGSTPLQMASTALPAPTGSALTSPIFQISGTGDLYTMIAGQYYHINDGAQLAAYGYPSKYGIQMLDASALFSVPYGGGLSQFVSNGGTTYYLIDGKAYPITNSYLANWLNGATAMAYPGTDFAQRFSIQSTALKDLVKDANNQTWLADAGHLINVTSFADAYNFSTPVSMNVATAGLAKQSGGTYLVRSTNKNDSRIWLINNGTKQWIVTAAEFYGYNGDTTAITSLSDAELSLIPTATPGADPSLIVTSGANGLKLLGSDAFYEFPVGGTATNSIIANQTILSLSPTVYSALYHSNGAISQLIKDASTQQIFYIENGQKRWITNGQAFSHYSSLPLVTVPSTLAQWFPSGSNINS